MAGGAIAPCGAARELAFVNVFMAIGALLMRNRLLEIGVLVTQEAASRGMFSMQRELGLIVVKSRLCAHRFPAGGDMARLAGAFKRSIHEGPAMRIRMAALTAREVQSLVAGRSTARRRRVALHAIEALMPTRQRIRCAAVIETRRWFPGVL